MAPSYSTLTRSFSTLLVLACLAILPASAEPQTRLLAADEQRAWNAVGRVNIAGFRSRRMCSGVLIASDRVLTAAHCVLKGRAPAPPEEIIFVAGWRSGVSAGDAAGAAVTFHPGFLAGVADGQVTIGTDVAIIALDKALDSVAPLSLAEADAFPDLGAQSLSIVGYRSDRPHIATYHEGCRLLDARPSAFATDCDVARGTSGAPVLADGTIVGVVSAKTPAGTLAARPQAWLSGTLP